MVRAKNIITSSLIISAFVLLGIVGFGASKAEAQTVESQSEQPQNQQTPSETYDYVAQPGDSYSLIARKAVQTYGIINKVNLSQAQILFAETNLTKEAGSPFLIKGQNVQVLVSNIEEWVNKAKTLTDSQQAAWSVYVARANFNTDAVGQPRN